MVIFSILFLTPELDSLIFKGIEKSYTEEFSLADSYFNLVIKEDSIHPAGYFFKSALYQLKYFDMGFDSIRKNFFTMQKKGIEVAKNYVFNNPQDPWGYFFLGGLYTLNVFFYGYFEDYINALKNLFPALNNITKAVKIDSSIYDAYIGLGGYDYFKGLLPFMKSEKEKAYRKIRLSIEKGRYTRFLSSSALANLLIRDKKYEEGRKIIRELLKEFPSSRTFTWHIFNSFYYEGNLDSALFYAKKLIELSDNNYFCYVQGIYFLSEILLKKKEKEAVLELTKDIDMEIFPEWGKKINKLRKEAEK